MIITIVIYRYTNDTSEPRTFEQGVNLLLKLFHTFTSLYKASGYYIGPNVPMSKNDLIQSYNNGNRRVATTDKFLTLADFNKQEGIMDNGAMMMMDNGEKKEVQPQFWLFDNFSKKMDLVNMTKIFLKLLILKKIVKFIALVCLLFFVPAFKDESKSEAKNSRKLDFYGKN